MLKRRLRPLILVRGFGGPDISQEQANPYQGFNDGTVYAGRRGDNYIYEGFVLRALKSELYPYRDATNVVGYYAEDVDAPVDPMGWAADLVSGTVVLDPPVAQRLLADGVVGTLWVYRYYDLKPRAISRYGEGLARLIDIIRRGAEVKGESFDGVDIIAHSMGGLVVRAALRHLTEQRRDARTLIHRIVTLGTPHRGIMFQMLPRQFLDMLPLAETGSDEFAAFHPGQTDFLDVEKWFDVRRILTVVGTNHRTYGTRVASRANRISTLFDEGTLAHNRSDGLVKQAAAQLPGAPRTFIHKCHGGPDSLVTSREAYEIAMRFLHGSHRVQLSLEVADVSRGGDIFGRSEFYLGVTVKPRLVDFELFHQSREAENCYGPFHDRDLRDCLPDLETALRESLAEAGDATTGWAGPNRLVWEGWVDAAASPPHAQDRDMVFRLNVYLGERDGYGIGFSDNVVFHKQYYIQALLDPLVIYVHTGEQFLGGPQRASRAELERRASSDPQALVQRAIPDRPGQWLFATVGTGFSGTWRIQVEQN